jgi:hypothetical protein
MKVSIDIDLTPEQLAQVFCSWDDERQAQFFIECARISSGWDSGIGMQWFSVGRHLRNCACSTEEARDMVTEIAEAIKT